MIELGSDHHLYEMTFSDDGKRVKGMWGTRNADPGVVEFTGIKTGDISPYQDCNIQHEWDEHDQRAYDRANRNRWRR